MLPGTAFWFACQIVSVLDMSLTLQMKEFLMFNSPKRGSSAEVLHHKSFVVLTSASAAPLAWLLLGEIVSCPNIHSLVNFLKR